jgi:hypothetical protein
MSPNTCNPCLRSVQGEGWGEGLSKSFLHLNLVLAKHDDDQKSTSLYASSPHPRPFSQMEKRDKTLRALFSAASPFGRMNTPMNAREGEDRIE